MKARTALIATLIPVVVIFAIPPVWSGVESLIARWRTERQREAERREAARIREWNEREPVILPERPDDRVRYPRTSFALHFVDGTGFEIDTAAKLDSLYESVLQGRLFDMRQPEPGFRTWAAGDRSAGVLTLRAGDAEHELEWVPWASINPMTDDYKRLDRTVRMLRRMVGNDPAFLSVEARVVPY